MGEIVEKNKLLLQEQKNLSEQISLMNEQNDKINMHGSNDWVWGETTDENESNDSEQVQKLKKIVVDNGEILNRYKQRISLLNKQMQESQLNEEKLKQQNENNQKQILFYKKTLEKQLKNSEQNTPTKSQKFIAELQNVSAIYQSNKLLKDGQKQRDERIVKLECELSKRSKEMDVLRTKLNNLNGDKSVLQNGYDQIQKELKIMRQNHQLIVTKYQKIDPKEYQRLLSMETVKKELQSQLNKHIATNNKYQATIQRSKQIMEQNKTKFLAQNAKIQSLASQLQSFKQNKQRMELEKKKLIGEKSKIEKDLNDKMKQFVSQNAMIQKNNSMINKYKQVMVNKKKRNDGK